jgi:hypothetical protein
MCDYCTKGKVVFETTNMANDGPWTFDVKALPTHADYDKWLFRQGVVIDSRGYIRLVDLDDYACIEAGQKIKISFCPFCGYRFKTNDDVCIF